MSARASSPLAAGERPRVYVCPGDESGWAIDEDRRTTLRALEGVVEVVDRPEDARVIHACWWEPLAALREEDVSGKPVICHCVGEVSRCLGEPRFQRALARATHWIAPTRASADDLRHVVDRVAHVPYVLDPRWFEEGPENDVARRAREAIPPIAFVVANFHRDTAGAGLSRGGGGGLVPKHVKGPDVFVEIMGELRRRGVPAVALLAGPRRHWVRRELTRRGVPWVFAGALDDARDDYPANILDRASLASLYRLADAYLSTSRSEGGPRTILEAAACETPVLASRTGIAGDALSPECVFDDALDAVDRLEREAEGDRPLSAHVRANLERVRVVCDVERARAAWARIYADLSPRSGGPRASAAIGERPLAVRPVARHVAPVISLWNHFKPPPWGGGNQFMLALKGEFERRGLRVVLNGRDPEGRGVRAAAHVLNSVQFDVDAFRAGVEPRAARVVHRIDGPISVLRGTPESLSQDRLCFDLNATYADATVIQSRHTLRFLREMGARPVRPVIIHNACDPGIFYPSPGATPPAAPPSPLRVVASAWSPSPGKGAAVYEYLSKHLDPARVRFTFVGNTPGELPVESKVAPLASENLADLLREHHVYLTASRNDPCSNALIEALTCGLPAVYLDSGGHPELVRFGGLPFTRPEEVAPILDRLAANLEFYRALIRVPTMREVADAYLALLLDDEAYRP